MFRSSVKVSAILLRAFVPFLCVAVTGCSSAVSSGAKQDERNRVTKTDPHAKSASQSSLAGHSPTTKNSPPGKTYSREAKQPGPAGEPSEEAPEAKDSSLAPGSVKKEIIEVVLSFDDGPHAASPESGRNYTRIVCDTLQNNLVQTGIKAVFFVQTHAAGRGATPIGQHIISRTAEAGHVVGIHTGSRKDHASHRGRALAAPYDVNRNGLRDPGDGANGLESDMIRAKRRIRELTGAGCFYVRPTYGERNPAVRAVYERQQLKMILWDIDSEDNNGSPSVDKVNFNIHEGMRRCLAAGKTQIIILFHDINSQTATNLEEYLGNIRICGRKLGKTVVFPTNTDRVMQILNAKDYQ